jgi:hypothetical protein
VHHGGQPQIGRVDVDTDFLGRFACRAVGQCLAFVEMPAWEVEHPIAVPGALALQKEYLLLAFEDDVDVDDRPVALGHPSSRWLVTAVPHPDGACLAPSVKPRTARRGAATTG